jgi:hypothetical protein
MFSLVSDLSLRHHPTMHWLHHRKAMMNSKHFRQSNTALRLEKLPISGTTVSIYGDTAVRRLRPYIPAPLWLQVFQSIHGLSDSGTKATAKLVAQRFVRPGVQNNCRTYARACQSCQCSKVSCHSHSIG